MANLHEKSPIPPPLPNPNKKKNTEYLVLFGSCPLEKHSQLFRPFLQSSEKHIIF